MQLNLCHKGGRSTFKSLWNMLLDFLCLLDTRRFPPEQHFVTLHQRCTHKLQLLGTAWQSSTYFSGPFILGANVQ